MSITKTHAKKKNKLALTWVHGPTSRTTGVRPYITVEKEFQDADAIGSIDVCRLQPRFERIVFSLLWCERPGATCGDGWRMFQRDNLVQAFGRTCISLLFLIEQVLAF